MTWPDVDLVFLPFLPFLFPIWPGSHATKSLLIIAYAIDSSDMNQGYCIASALNLLIHLPCNVLRSLIYDNLDVEMKSD